MAKPGVYRGRCRCGQVLTFRQGPWGYKVVCPTCGAVVRLKAPAPRTAGGQPTAWTDSTIVVRCEKCALTYPATFKHLGRHLACPRCGYLNVVPMPGRDSGEIRQITLPSEDERPTEEMPTRSPPSPSDPGEDAP